MSKLILSYTKDGWNDQTIVDNYNVIDDTTSYDELGDSTPLFVYLFDEELQNVYSTSGTRTSPNITLEEINTRYRISWIASTPTGASITIETNVSLDNGATWLGWKLAKNNQFIPDISSTTDLTTGLLQIRQTLQTTNAAVTPTLESVTIVADNSDNINVKSGWTNDTSILAKFVNTLEAGNINNEGVKIVKFKVARREADQDEDIYLGEVNYDGIQLNMEFEDGTQPNGDLIYTIIPVGENGLDGSPKEVNFKSDFTGVWIVDKDTKEVLVFDKAIGNVGNFESTLTQDRALIETFSPRPQVYYGSMAYETFTLSTVVLPDDNERSGKKYKDILNKFILDHKPKIVKTDTGRIMVCDISNLRASSPMNTWENSDYFQIQIDAVETADYEEFMKEE